jgi:hypothetical protein
MRDSGIVFKGIVNTGNKTAAKNMPINENEDLSPSICKRSTTGQRNARIDLKIKSPALNMDQGYHSKMKEWPYYGGIVSFGHVGAKKSFEIARFVMAKDVLDASTLLQSLHGAKSTGIRCCYEVSEAEYYIGKVVEREWLSRHFARKKKKITRFCIGHERMVKQYFSNKNLCDILNEFDREHRILEPESPYVIDALNYVQRAYTRLS